jgi:hypothetical protein
MFTFPTEITTVIAPFAPLFSETVWYYAQILLIGAILAPGKRTVSAVLTVLGQKDDAQYQNYHRVLNRAKWSSFTASKILLGLLVAAFVAAGAAVIIGADETWERRKGEKIKDKSVFRDAVRSSKKYTVHSFGLRWVSMMVIVAVPWSSRAWGLPFLTVSAPSEKTNEANRKRHKSSIALIMQMIAVVGRWLPKRALVLVTDGGLTAVKLGLRCAKLANPVTYVSRLRLDAQLYDQPPEQAAGKRGSKPKKGVRQASLKERLEDKDTKWTKLSLPWYGGKKYLIEFVSGTSLWHTSGFDPLPIRWVLVRDPAGKYKATAFLCTDRLATPLQILGWFILRWNVEVTFQEVNTHLGFGTQRQWSDLAIARTTPALLALFSIVTLLAYNLTHNKAFPVRSSAWSDKKEATFSDALALVRRVIWTKIKFNQSPQAPDLVLIPPAILQGLGDAMCYMT